VIGVTISKTGSGAGTAAYVLQGYQRWVGDANHHGGLLGRQVQLRVYDDRSDPATAASLYRKLISEDKVDLLAGPYAAMLLGDLDAEVAACRMGARRVADLFRRYGRQTVEDCFEAILTRTTATFQKELLSKIPPGTYVWEDYAEHDGVDPPRLHTQRMTLTALPEGRLIIDFAGTGPQARGPINHAGNYADGVFLKKWIAPILRLARSRADARARELRSRFPQATPRELCRGVSDGKAHGAARHRLDDGQAELTAQ